MKKNKKNKYLSDTDVESIKNMTQEELLKDYFKQNRALAVIKKRKKEDTNIKSLKEEIKEHRQSVSSELKERLEKAKEEVKEVKMEIDEPILNLIADMKDINAEYKEDMGYSKERLKLLLSLIK